MLHLPCNITSPAVFTIKLIPKGVCFKLYVRLPKTPVSASLQFREDTNVPLADKKREITN